MGQAPPHRRCRRETHRRSPTHPRSEARRASPPHLHTSSRIDELSDSAAGGASERCGQTCRSLVQRIVHGLIFQEFWLLHEHSDRVISADAQGRLRSAEAGPGCSQHSTRHRPALPRPARHRHGRVSHMLDNNDQMNVRRARTDSMESKSSLRRSLSSLSFFK
jgi:hypothetical protein